MKNKRNLISTSVLAACLYLSLGSCEENNFIGSGSPIDGEPVSLQFTAGITGMPAPEKTRALAGGGVIEGTSFPLGSQIGMFMTAAGTAGAEVFPGSAKMKATLSTNTAGTETWDCTRTDNNASLTPQGYTGKEIEVTAYWPYSPMATATSIPFDFTNITATGQREILYNKTDRQKQVIAPDGKVALMFRHAYTRVTLNITKSADGDNIRIDSISISNQNNQWIKNKGSINPATGWINQGAQSGALTDKAKSDLLDTKKAVTYSFLIPAFMDTKANNEDIVFILWTEGKKTIFPLQRNHLNKITESGQDKYGFNQGYKNTYDLVYDNTTLSMILKAWSFVSLDANIGLPTTPDSSYEPWSFDFRPPVVTDIAGASAKLISDHRYENYLTDFQRGGNGTQTIILSGTDSWQALLTSPEGTPTNEPPYQHIQVAMKDAFPSSLQWRNPEGIMTAKQICTDYREGGYTNWRLPRIAEWYMIISVCKRENGYVYFPREHGGNIFGMNPYWSGTEDPFGNVHIVRISINQDNVSWDNTTQPLPPNNLAHIRCVREVH